MSRRHDPLKPLQHEQGLAADPQVHAAVSASAGTGKTQVLTARVLRLLLGGVRPESILCLTFTKAGAAEMANRIGKRLARWVRMKDPDLRKDLSALDEPTDDETLENARRLFARVLEAPGGLRIQTIHSFAQTLLAAFPAEAGIMPGFQPIEGRAEQELARRTLANLAANAEARGDTRLISDIQLLSMRLGEQGAEKYLLDCAHAGEGLAALGPPEAIEPALRALVGLPEGDIDEALASSCDDSRFDCALLRAIADANLSWGGVKGQGYAAAIDEWLALDFAGRAAALDRLAAVFLTGKGEPRKVSPGQVKAMADYDSASAAMVEAIGELLAMRSAAQLVAAQAAGLRAGQAYAADYDRAKRAAGVADFDDLIRWTRRLLDTPGMGEWVRFKLDRRTDHILVDEAQDTNEDQWRIVDALRDEFFSGSSEAESRWRTLFMVGDFKQAIFRFQGTDPSEYEKMRKRVQGDADSLVEAAREDPDIVPREFRDLSISASFRSSPIILDLVDAAIDVIGHEAMGLPAPPPAHHAFHVDRPGHIEWWPAMEPDSGNGEEGEEGWLDEADRAHATRIARQVRRWLDEKPVMASTGRPLSPGDILILVRSRGELASLIVARLFAEKVPVAGIDRLHLHRPLAVKDLLSAITFAVQPLDDLNLAGLLVSPLIGWDQDQLYRAAHSRRGPLWNALVDCEASNPDCALALERLRPILAMADYAVPSRFLEHILSGPMRGRRELIRRLGPEARDPIEELVSAALEFERSETPSLDRFLSWFASGDVEIKRDPSAPADAVRVMTVHGAKGLEAPLVILADATSDPDKLGAPNPPLEFPVEGHVVPLVRPRRAERCSPFAELIEHDETLDRAEHWRLLYVALTRSRERLVVSGIRKRGEAARTWHHVIEQALERIGAAREEDGRLIHHSEGKSAPFRSHRKVEVASSLPEWLHRPPPPEPRPARPLAPSTLAEDDLPYPPPAPFELDAARRGTLLHRLFERLPEVAPDDRRQAALGWLERSAGLSDAAVRDMLADLACSIIGDPDHEELFGPGSLAEAPIAATLPDGRVIAGAVDRLLVEAGRVRFVDFKTGSQVPGDAASVPRSHRLQMEAYRDALKVIFPGCVVEAALLYTSGPKILDLPG
ncbi:double-strand break repair helicase AddA [Sphingomonas sp. HDW15A]|uniref:double-strand break repair helicase AddA n=1 Tax=Sphingomonas sp. HDW15A TaxID=2714942 RepID=UPI00140981EF|nr:double-strand break repair helicase AddA [Sphingomonas sp. HDW15A]QIK95967.1 double-strand break repair helicase AddA [Sphingomonas sp. HDW15A]